jgi:hypothetical protein
MSRERSDAKIANTATITAAAAEASRAGIEARSPAEMDASSPMPSPVIRLLTHGGSNDLDHLDGIDG